MVLASRAARRRRRQSDRQTEIRGEDHEVVLGLRADGVGWGSGRACAAVARLGDQSEHVGPAVDSRRG